LPAVVRPHVEFAGVGAALAAKQSERLRLVANVGQSLKARDNVIEIGVSGSKDTTAGLGHILGSKGSNKVPSVDFGLAGVNSNGVRSRSAVRRKRSGSIQKVTSAVAAAIVSIWHVGPEMGVIIAGHLTITLVIATLSDDARARSVRYSRQGCSNHRRCVADTLGVQISALNRGVASPAILNSSWGDSAETISVEKTTVGLIRVIACAVLNARITR